MQSPISEPLNMYDDLYNQAYCADCESRNLTDSERAALAKLLTEEKKTNESH